jgi:hypothetical protein
MIVENTILANLSLDNDTSRVFECRTSISNPQAQLIITRQGTNGEKHLDIQYKTSSSYINGINSIQFMVCFLFHLFANPLLGISSYRQSIFHFIEIF